MSSNRLLSFVALALFTSACSGSSFSEAPPLAGTYSGAYSGGDTGSIQLDVAASGDVQLTAVSNFWRTTAKGSGQVQVDGSNLSGTGIAPLVLFTFTGTVSNGSASGAWSASNGAKGTWSANHL